MIISASRRTDIPAFYGEWLINRIKAGEVITRNPFNPAQKRRVSLLHGDVDCFVFWTKDPGNFMDKLDFLDKSGYSYYFQFTVTPYGGSIERNLRAKDEIIHTFIELSGRIGRERVLWRYDPIILNEHMDIGYHQREFERLCGLLSGYTASVTISFADMYKKIKPGILREISDDEMLETAEALSEAAGKTGLEIRACCEKLDMSALGIKSSACIDKCLVERLIGGTVSAAKDKNQRPGCGCAQSVDIGVYNTCGNGCVYCYANHSPASIMANMARHDPNGESLIPL